MCLGAVTETLPRYSLRCWQDLGGDKNVLLLFFGVFQYFIEFYTVRESLSQRGQRDSGWLSLAMSLKSRHYGKGGLLLCLHNGETDRPELTLSLSSEIGIVTLVK